MFCQTYTACKPPSACTAVTTSPPSATEWFRLLRDDVICSVRRTQRLTNYNALSLERKTAYGDLDLCPRHSYSSERESKHVFPVNLTQIRSAVPEIFEAQTKKSQTALKTEPSRQ